MLKQKALDALGKHGTIIEFCAGKGELSRTVYKHTPKTRYIAIDIDPIVQELKQDIPHIIPVQMDNAQWITRELGNYDDVSFADFDAYDNHPQLVEKFLENYKGNGPCVLAVTYDFKSRPIPNNSDELVRERIAKSGFQSEQLYGEWSQHNPVYYSAYKIWKELGMKKSEDIITKPFGKWPNFPACVDDMKEQGKSDESARKICGALQRDLGEKDLKKQDDLDRICGDIWFNGTEAQRSGFSGGTGGRGRNEKPPKAWWDDCTSSVGKKGYITLPDGVTVLPDGSGFFVATIKQEGRDIRQIGEDQDRWIIAGYASVEMVDKQGDIISVEALREAFRKFMASGFANINLVHSEATIGRVIPEYVDKDGKTWKSQVDDVGEFIVVEIRKDIEVARKAWELIKNGTLKAFSLGGQALDKDRECDEKGCHNLIKLFEQWAVNVVERGANIGAKFGIIKTDLPCFENKLVDFYTAYGVSDVKAKILGPLSLHFLEHLADTYSVTSQSLKSDQKMSTQVPVAPTPNTPAPPASSASAAEKAPETKQDPMQHIEEMIAEILKALHGLVQPQGEAKPTSEPEQKTVQTTKTVTEPITAKTEQPPLILKSQQDFDKAMEKWFDKNKHIIRKSAPIAQEQAMTMLDIIDKIEKGEDPEELLRKGVK